MKALVVTLALCLGQGLYSNVSPQNISVNSDGAPPDPSALLDIQSDNKGLLIPRMTTAQRETIASPAEGLLVFDLDSGSFWYYQNGEWLDLNQINRAFELNEDTIRNSSNFHKQSFLIGSPTFEDEAPPGIIPYHSKLFFNKYKRAFRAGSTLDSIEYMGLPPVYFGKPQVWNSDSVGYFSFAGGVGNVASGFIASTAFGLNCAARGNNGATAMGYSSMANGATSFAAGRSAKAIGHIGTISIGDSTLVSGSYGSTAIGRMTEANGDMGAIALGNNSVVNGSFGAIAIGNDTHVSGSYGATAIGSKVKSGANGSVVLGMGSQTDTLINDIPSSLMVGFDSDIPTLFVGPSSGTGTVGNVGIGTSNATELLTVGKTIGTFPGTYITVGEDNYSSGIILGEDAQNYSIIQWGVANDFLVIGNTVAGSPNSTMALKDNKLGIGTNAPSENLVVGDNVGAFPGTFTVTGDPLNISGFVCGENNLNYGAMSWAPNNDYLTIGTSVSGSTGASIVLRGDNIGINTNDTRSLLTMQGPDDIDSGPIFTLYGTSSDQVESGRLRFLEGTAANNWRGGFIHYDGNANRFHMGVHNTSDADPLNDLNSISIDRGTGYIGIGTSSPNNELTIFDMGGNGDAIIRMKGTAGGAKEMIMGFNQSVGGILGTVSATNLTFRTSNSTRMTIEGTGNVGIGIGTPSYKLEVNGDINALGAIRCNGVNSCSDLRFKKDITPIENATLLISKMQGVKYFWDVDQYPDKQFKTTEDIGFIAQDIESVIPEVVSTDKEGFKSIDYSKLTVVLVEAVKEQQKLIFWQDEKIQMIETRLEFLETVLSETDSSQSPENITFK